MELYIPDPYLFIYPDPDPDVPLDPKKVASFILNLFEWSKVFGQQNITIGLSSACLEELKQHQRSILNGKFLGELLDVISQSQQQAVILVRETVTRLKRSTAFGSILNQIDHEKVDYELHDIDVDPDEFCQRLPSTMQYHFRQMLGELAFALKQKWYPISTFTKFRFPTRCEADHRWLKTRVKVTYVVDESLSAKPLKLPLEGRHLPILRNPADELETQPVRPIRTISSAVQKITQLYPADVLVSDQLREILVKNNDVLANSSLEQALEALATYYLSAYRAAKAGDGSATPAVRAKQAFNQRVSFELSGESKTVRTSSRLSEQRAISLNGEPLGEAYLHVKLGSKFRLHFNVCWVNGKYCVVLGHIGNHLETTTS